MKAFDRWLCRHDFHDWNLTFRRVGEDQTCRRGCGAVARATDQGWRLCGSRSGRRVPRGVPGDAPR